MVSLSQRMRKLQTKLLAIRLGSGALALPKDVKRIHMRFAEKINGGHMGPRKFWRHELVRLKYHNPAVSMTIDRTANAEEEAVMSIHFAPSDSSPTSSSAPINSTSTSTPPSDHDPTERVETIRMRHKTNSQILEELQSVTKAKAVEPTEEEQEEVRSLEEQRVRSQRTREMSLEARARVKRERMLLEQARGEMAAQAA